MAKVGKKSSSRIPKDESKSDRFVRVVTPRVAKAVKAIRVVGYCAGAGYEYTPKQISQINAALATALQALAERFVSKTAVESEFNFEG